MANLLRASTVWDPLLDKEKKQEEDVDSSDPSHAMSRFMVGPRAKTTCGLVPAGPHGIPSILGSVPGLPSPVELNTCLSCSGCRRILIGIRIEASAEPTTPIA